MEERQILRRPTVTPAPTAPVVDTECAGYNLLAGGIITIDATLTITLTEDAPFQPTCTASSDVILTGDGSGNRNSLTDFRDPFYASTLPECYALAAATVVAYLLLIMLLITPRTFLHDGAVVLGRRGFTNGPSGGNNGIGIGGRPWLQKVAAASVAISLTIATSETFRIAEAQYELGFMDAATLQEQVESGTALKVFRVVSDTFLWLAQAQTLIRLFPRQREKIIIKWTAFALISLDVVFSILNNVIFKGRSHFDGKPQPQKFADAIPALSYLFQLSLSLLYCAWVIYYALTKKRFAFYHKQMRNQCLVALLSLVSVLVPVVFFVVDISKPDVAGWGDYVRWVGAAAASVVVWEWVERIEALERNEKRDGVLGREIFDGDEMLDATPKAKSHWADCFNGGRNDDDDEKRGGHDGDGDKNGGGGGGGTGGAITSGVNAIWPGVTNIANRYRPRASQDLENGTADDTVERTRRKRGIRKRGSRPRPPLWPTRPPQAATPVSRTDTASAESTIYAVRYHPLSESTPSSSNRPGLSRLRTTDQNEMSRSRSFHGRHDQEADNPDEIDEKDEAAPEVQQKKGLGPLSKVNPFRRKFQGPPPEVTAHAVKLGELNTLHGSSSRWDVRAKLEDFAVTQAERIRDRSKNGEAAMDLPVTVIPAPTRRKHYEAALAELQERDEIASMAVVGNDDIDHEPQYEPEPLISPHTQRVSDPYTPDDINGHSVHQRGAISFITAAPQERPPVLISETTTPTRPETQGNPTVVQNTTASSSPAISSSPAFSSNNSPAQLRGTISPTLSSPSRKNGLPVLSIPAPARRPRSRSDSE